MSTTGLLLATTRALLIAAVFIITAILAIRVFGNQQPLSAADIIALLTGAVTAAGLFAIYLQVQAAQKDASDRENQRAIEMAVRADQLHMEFNAEDMRRHRDIAYPYLMSLRDNPELLGAFAKYWIYDQVDHRLSPIGGTEASIRPDWSVSVMVAFFVRLSSHVKFYDDRVNRLNAEDTAKLIGPFFWKYWAEAGMKALVEQCASLHDNTPSKFGKPYFVKPLQDLSMFSDRAGGV